MQLELSMGEFQELCKKSGILVDRIESPQGEKKIYLSPPFPSELINPVMPIMRCNPPLVLQE